MSRAATTDTPARLTKGERTRLAMVETAIDILDEDGPDGLTLQDIGERLGLHRTAVYRHFASRDELLAGAMEYIFRQMYEQVTLPQDPRGRISTIALEMRRMFHRHPGAAAMFVTVGEEWTSSSALERVILQALRDMSVDEEDLATVYQALESYVVGSTLFDFSGAPHHLEMRRRRHAASGDQSLTRAASSTARIDATNEAAFTWGLDALLDSL